MNPSTTRYRYKAKADKNRKKETTPVQRQRTASAPNRLPKQPPKAVGISVRGFMLCITARVPDVKTAPLDRLLPVKWICDVGEENVGRLEETDGFAHRRLDVQGLDVLPVLLQEGDEEVDAYLRCMSGQLHDWGEIKNRSGTHST